MRPSHPSFRLVVMAALMLPFLAAPAKAAGPREAQPIDRWLLLGPASFPLPLFHDEDRGGYDIEDLMEQETFLDPAFEPVAGDPVGWFDGRVLEWATVETAEPAIPLSVPAADAAGLAVAWLATYVDVFEFVTVDIELLGSHPRGAWLDGESIATGGEDADDDERVRRKRVELAPGRHLLLLRTVRDPDRDAAWSAGALVTPREPGSFADFATATAGERTVTLRDILDAPQITSLALAPQGRRAALTVRQIVPGTHEVDSWVEVRAVGRAGGVIDGWFEPYELDAIAWSPNGRYISYLADVGKGEENQPKSLHVYDHATRETEVLLDWVDRLDGYAWSPTGSSLVYWTREPAEPDERGVKRLQGLLDRRAGHRDTTRLHLLTVPTRATRPLTAGGTSTDFRAFAPDGGRILFTRTVEDYARRPYTRHELWELDLTTFAAARLRDFLWLDGVDYSPDGRRLLVLTQPSEFGARGLDVPEGAVANSYDGQLFVWDPRSDDVDPISREFNPAVLDAVWGRADGMIYVKAADGDYVRLYRYDPARRTYEALAVPFDVVDEFEVAKSEPVVLGTGSSPWVPPALFYVDDEGPRRRPSPADAWFTNVGGGTVAEWSFDASSGRTIAGRVYLPPRFDPERKYPAIVYYYGGTNPVDRDFGGRYPKEWWASRGYVVYVPQPSGAVGFGQAFSAAHVNDWGETTVDEIVEGTRKFLDAHSFVDRDRVGCIGASFGGFITMRLVTETDLFAAAVSHAGISSLASYWGQGYWGYSYSAVATADSFPWNRPELYVDRSPLFRADRASVPLLLTHGRADTNVPVGESDAFFVALRLLGKPVEYVQIEGENHWIQDHAKREVWSSTVMAWFDRWLKGRPEWWTSLYSESETGD